jgi:hypothetical protein
MGITSTLFRERVRPWAEPTSRAFLAGHEKTVTPLGYWRRQSNLRWRALRFETLSWRPAHPTAISAEVKHTVPIFAREFTSVMTRGRVYAFTDSTIEVKIVEISDGAIRENAGYSRMVGKIAS